MDINLSQLRGKHVYLEPLTPDHAAIIKTLARDERIWEFTKTLLVTEAYDRMFESYISTALDTAANGGQQAFVIRKTADDEVIGMTRLYEIEPKDRRVMIGHTWYVPSTWGKVYNKECKYLLLCQVFETWKFNRVALMAAHQNIRSQKAIEKIGGVKEGILRKYGYRNDGSTRDAVVFSIISDEWPEKKEKLLQLIAGGENH